MPINKDVYKDLNATARRAKELDSCLWAESDGKYKSFTEKDMAKKTSTTLSATTNWESKEAPRNYNNQDRVVNDKRVTQDYLASQALPLSTYEAPQKPKYEETSQDDRRKLFDSK